MSLALRNIGPLRPWALQGAVVFMIPQAAVRNHTGRRKLTEATMSPTCVEQENLHER